MNKNFIKKNNYVVWISFLMALILDSISWSQKLIYFKPNFAFLFLIYWVMYLSYKIDIIWNSFFLGFLVDLIQGFNFGIHSLVYVFCSYFIFNKKQMFKNLTLLSQSCFIFFFSFIMNLIIFLIEFIFFSAFFHVEILFISLVNCLIWPLVFFVLKRIQILFLK